MGPPLRRGSLRPGDVEVSADGAGLRVEPLAADDLEEVAGRLVIPAGGDPVTDEDVRALRESDQR